MNILKNRKKGDTWNPKRANNKHMPCETTIPMDVMPLSAAPITPMETTKPANHAELVEVYNALSGEKYHLKEVDEQVSGDVHNSFDVDSINKIAVMLSTALNLEGGSVGSIDLYKLLQGYILDPVKRSEINKITRGY